MRKHALASLGTLHCLQDTAAWGDTCLHILKLSNVAVISTRKNLTYVYVGIKQVQQMMYWVPWRSHFPKSLKLHHVYIALPSFLKFSKEDNQHDRLATAQDIILAKNQLVISNFCLILKTCNVLGQELLQLAFTRISKWFDIHMGMTPHVR